MVFRLLLVVTVVMSRGLHSFRVWLRLIDHVYSADAYIGYICINTKINCGRWGLLGILNTALASSFYACSYHLGSSLCAVLVMVSSSVVITHYRASSLHKIAEISSLLSRGSVSVMIDRCVLSLLLLFCQQVIICYDGSIKTCPPAPFGATRLRRILKLNM